MNAIKVEYPSTDSNEWLAGFNPEELKDYHKRLADGEYLSCNRMGGCHTFIRNVINPNRNHLETLTSYDNIHFTMGIGANYGLRIIESTTPEDIVDWYNELQALKGNQERYKFVKYDDSNQMNRSVLVEILQPEPSIMSYIWSFLF